MLEPAKVNQSAHRLALALGLCCLLLSPMPLPAAGSGKTIDQANQSRAAAEAEQLSALKRHAEAASRFEQLAVQANAMQRDHWLLKAARNAQLANNDSKARALLGAASNTLSADDIALKALISATEALRASQNDRALAALDALPLPLPAAYAADLLAVRTDALFASGRTVLAVNVALERERLFKSSEDIANVRQQLWKQLTQAAASGANLAAPAGVAQQTAGWLELARLSAVRQRDPFGYTRGMNDWRSRYPDHPGATVIANSLVATNSSNTSFVVGSSAQHIALLLPLTGRQQAAGIAVRDGFMAAALSAGGAPPSIEVFDTNETGALDAYQRALQRGASMVVGPLLKEEVESLASSQQVGVTTLALNVSGNAGESGAAPALMFRFALNPEEEARQAAQRAWDDGLRRAIVLTPGNDWGQRVFNAFAARMQQLGSTIVEAYSYDPGGNDHVRAMRQLFASRTAPPVRELNDALGGKRDVTESRNDFDFVFMAAQAAQARQLRPAIKFVMANNQTPVYALSDSVDPAGNNADLDDLRFADMPWVINRDAQLSALYETVNRFWAGGLRARSRLYAFGIDAYRLSSWLNTPQPQWAAPLRGATGLLALDQSGVVHRELDWAQIVNGKPQLLPESSGAR